MCRRRHLSGVKVGTSKAASASNSSDKEAEATIASFRTNSITSNPIIFPSPRQQRPYPSQHQRPRRFRYRLQRQPQRLQKRKEKNRRGKPWQESRERIDVDQPTGTGIGVNTAVTSVPGNESLKGAKQKRDKGGKRWRLLRLHRGRTELSFG